MFFCKSRAVRIKVIRFSLIPPEADKAEKTVAAFDSSSHFRWTLRLGPCSACAEELPWRLVECSLQVIQTFSLLIIRILPCIQRFGSGAHIGWFSFETPFRSCELAKKERWSREEGFQERGGKVRRYRFSQRRKSWAWAGRSLKDTQLAFQLT